MPPGLPGILPGGNNPGKWETLDKEYPFRLAACEMKNKAPSIDEIIALPEIGDVQISPDGKHAAFTVTQPDWQQNEYIAQIWLVSVAGGAEPIQLTFSNVSSRMPRWSPDGCMLGFLSRRAGDAHEQVYLLHPFGGEARRLTCCRADVKGFYWSPGSKAIAFLLPEPDTIEKKQRVAQYGDFHVEGVDYRCNQLWLYSLESGSSFPVVSEPRMHVQDLDWSPDGSRILFEAWPSPAENDFDQGKVYLYELGKPGFKSMTKRGSGSPRWSADGHRFAYTCKGSPSFFGINHLRIQDLHAQRNVQISDRFDEEIFLLDWAEEGVYFYAIQKTAIHLFCMDPDDGRCEQISPSVPGGWSAQQYSFSADFTLAACPALDCEHAAEVMLLDLADTTRPPQRLTHFTNQTESWLLGRNELFTWESTDGTRIEGVLTLPPDFDEKEKHPLLVVIHGGPSWVSLSGLLATYTRMYPIQQWANQGALVLQPNYRGSAGYGQAFRLLNMHNLGIGDAWDVISGVEALLERGWVDPERVGALGWSQGGYISAFVGVHSDRFKAVSVGAGVTNWATYYANTDIQCFTRQYFEATPWEDPAIYQATSPMSAIMGAKTPALIQHGSQDRRVPIPNAFELYHGLRDVGVEQRFVIYPGQPHGIRKPRLNRHIMQENLEWFNRWLWDEPPTRQPEIRGYIYLPSKSDIETCGGDLPALLGCQQAYSDARIENADLRALVYPEGLIDIFETSVSPESLFVSSVLDFAHYLADQIRRKGWTALVLYADQGCGDPHTCFLKAALHLAAGLLDNVKIEDQSALKRETE